MSRPFPSDPAQRRAIVVLDEHEIERCGYEPGGKDLILDPEVHVVAPTDRSADSALQGLRDSGMLRRGAVLVQNPFDRDDYVESAQAAQTLALAKHTKFSAFCLLLGAKSVEVEHVEARDASDERKQSGKASSHGVGGSGSREEKARESLRSSMRLRDTFKGGAPDLVGAESLLRRSGLWGDPNMRTLLEMRAATTNELVERHLTLDLTSEAHRSLNVVGKLKVPQYVTLDIGYDRAVKEKLEFTIKVCVRF